MKNCASCQHWKPTEIHNPALSDPFVQASAPPHVKRAMTEQVELMRATMALCNWPATPAAKTFFETAPFWMERGAAARGVLTAEDSGFDCIAWAAREEIDIIALARQGRPEKRGESDET